MNPQTTTQQPGICAPPLALEVTTNGKPPPQDRIAVHILGALDAINEAPTAVFELSILRSRRGRDVLEKGYYNDRQALAREAAKQTLDTASIAVYVNLQAIDPQCLHRAHNKMSENAKPMTGADVTRYTRFLIDVDRAGVKGISATEAEKAEIREALAAIKEFLLDQGWPDQKFEGDSGNGGHIAWALHLPPTKENQELLKRCYLALQQKFGSEAFSIDSSLADPNQLIKLYGTMTRKGDNTPDRPHRFSRLLHACETEPVSLPQLQALAALAVAPAHDAKQVHGGRRYWKAGTPETVEAWAAGHKIALGKREDDSHPTTGQGYKWRVGCLTSDEHKDGAAIFLNGNGNIKYRCHHNSCAGKSEMEVLANYPPPAKEKAAREKAEHVTWAEYTEALVGMGYSPRINELDDGMEVNGKRLDDGTEAEILMRMADDGYDKAEWVKRAMLATAHQNRHHPVKDFLSGLVWDGRDHIAKLERYVRDSHPQIIYADGARMPVFRAWLRRWGIGAVGKVFGSGAVRTQNPMLVLAGPQDVGKSTLAKFLCPMGDDYFMELSIKPDDKEHDRLLATKLVWEVGELGATTRKADRDALKAFLTRHDATFRVPYGRNFVTKPALASFIGTINPETGFLNDPTGQRRFLPVNITTIDFAYIQNVDPLQLWAQFMALYKAGESHRLTTEEKEMADTIRAGHEVEDQFVGFIAKYYDIDLRKAGADNANLPWSTTTTDVVEQMILNGVPGANTTNVGIALARLKLGKGRKQIKGVQETRWYGLQRNNHGFTTRAQLRAE